MVWYEHTYPVGVIPFAKVPLLGYQEFVNAVSEKIPQNCHCSNYFGIKNNDGIRFYCFLIDNDNKRILINSWNYGYYDAFVPESLTALFPMFHPFEREISEKYGIEFKNNPYDKPLRFPSDRYDKRSNSGNYPYYSVPGHLFHEVNVGPIHAGIIEPGVFRFVCNGEAIIHMEVVLGFQNRGMETLIRSTDNILKRICLSENIAGDSAVSHATSLCSLHEILGGIYPDPKIDIERTIAREMERIAMHIADASALCADVAYQIGEVSCEAIRTIAVNTFLKWCGNRFGKGLIRTGGTYYPINKEIINIIFGNITEIKKRYSLVGEDIMSEPSVLSRFEDCGIVDYKEVKAIGCVGMAVRSSGLNRDIRSSLLFDQYKNHKPVIFTEGDVMARFKVRHYEILQSCDYILEMLSCLEPEGQNLSPVYSMSLQPDSLAFVFNESWRGELCHMAATDERGKLIHYKIKDPSLHNWYALSVCVRGEEISDFPICNKSFNLSYCGHDL